MVKSQGLPHLKFTPDQGGPQPATRPQISAVPHPTGGEGGRLSQECGKIVARLSRIYSVGALLFNILFEFTSNLS